MSRLAVSVAGQFGIEKGSAPIGFVRRLCSAHDPASLGSAWFRLSAKSKQDGGDILLRRQKIEPAARHQIENFRETRNFGDNRA